VKPSLRYPIVLLLLALAVWVGIDMHHLYQDALLWGYRPMWLFLATWGAFILLIGSRFSRYDATWQWLGLSTLSGVLLAVGFPSTIAPFPFAMFVGFVPLLIVERAIAARRPAASKWEVFKFAYHAFIVWNIITTFWVANTALVAGIVAICANTFLMTIPFVLFHQTKQVLPRLGYIAFVTYWIAFEYGHLNWELTWPWLTIGNSFAEWPSFVQWYEYTGVFGGGLWILLLNLMFFQLWRRYIDGSILRYSILRIAILLTLPMAFSLAIYINYEEKGRPFEVALVQPNYEPHYEKFSVSESEQVDRFLQLSAAVVDSTTDYLLFPETVFGYVETRAAADYPAIRRVREFLASYPGVQLISGLNAYHVLAPSEPHSRATRERLLPDGTTMYYEVLNAAAQLDPRSGELQWYRKSKLVPGPEIFPYPKFFFMFKAVVEQLEGTVAGVGTQPERAVFTSPKGRIAPVICYESVFGEFFTGYIRKGAQAAFIMTNDGWWDDTPGHRQHLYFAGLRAIETRRSIARSANTGISAFINQYGDITKSTAYGVEAAIQKQLLLNDEITFYVRWGDLIARLALFAGALLLLNTLSRSLIRRKETKQEGGPTPGGTKSE